MHVHYTHVVSMAAVALMATLVFVLYTVSLRAPFVGADITGDVPVALTALY